MRLSLALLIALTLTVGWQAFALTEKDSKNLIEAAQAPSPPDNETAHECD